MTKVAKSWERNKEFTDMGCLIFLKAGTLDPFCLTTPLEP